MAHLNDSLQPIEALEVDRNRYNAAFEQLGLEWHWDRKTYAELQTSLRDRTSPVHAYVETRVPHLLRAYDSDFLANAIETMRTEIGGPAA